jgi:hypothetical protein
MPLKPFDLEALSEIFGGRVKVAFDQAFERCELDCRDRPTVKKERTCALTIGLKPVADEAGELRSVHLRFEITETSPKRHIEALSTVPGQKGLLYNKLSEDDARQTTIDGPTLKIGTETTEKEAAANGK